MIKMDYGDPHDNRQFSRTLTLIISIALFLCLLLILTVAEGHSELLGTFPVIFYKFVILITCSMH